MRVYLYVVVNLDEDGEKVSVQDFGYTVGKKPDDVRLRVAMSIDGFDTDTMGIEVWALVS